MRPFIGFIALAGLGGLVFVAMRMSAEGPGESVAGQAVREELGIPAPEDPAKKKSRELLERGDKESNYTPSEVEVLQGLVNLGRARWESYGEWVNSQTRLGIQRNQEQYGLGGTPIRSTRTSTAADRELLAEVVCRRAVDYYGMPAGQLSTCIATVSPVHRQTSPLVVSEGAHFPNEHAYTLPGGKPWVVGI